MNDDLKTLIELTRGDPEDCNQLLSISKFDLEFALKLLLKAGSKLDPTIRYNIEKWLKDNGKEVPIDYDADGGHIRGKK